MPYPCDEVREFSIKMRVFFIEVRVFSVKMRKRCFFKPSALRCNHYYDKTCQNLALLAPSTETQIVTLNNLAPKLHPSCTHAMVWVQDGCRMGCKILGANCLIMSTGCKKCKIIRFFIYCSVLNKLTKLEFNL